MAARVTAVVGPARSGKTEHLLGVYRSALAVKPAIEAVESVLWIAPSQRTAEAVRTRLPTAAMPACFSPGIVTFAQLADRVLDHAADEIRPIDARTQRLLVEQLLQEAKAGGRLPHFGPIADTPGLVDLAVEFIRELKRNEIWPEDFAKACGGMGAQQKTQPKNRELHELYTRYQDLLVKHRLYDAEGQLWSARDRLQNGQQRPFDRLRLVVVDGFTDLTRTQHEIVDALAVRAEAVYVGLVDDPESPRGDLFSKPRGTLARLQSQHKSLRIDRLTPPDAQPTKSLRHVERELFKNPRLITRSGDAAGLEILAASGRVAEIEELARRIKRLLVEGDATDKKTPPVRPDDVAVIFRSLDEVAPLVREVFTRYGLPFSLEAGRRLDQSPSLTALQGLLELDAEDWPFRKLLAVTGSNFFRPKWPEAEEPLVAEAVEATIRGFALPRGRAKLLEQVEKLASSSPREAKADNPNAEFDEQHNARRNDAVRAGPVLRQLGEAFDRLPQRADARTWADALRQLAETTGLWRSLHEADELPDGDGSTSLDVRADRKAWARFHEVLKTVGQLASLVDGATEQLDRAALLKLVREIIRDTQLPSDSDESGKVRVLKVESARHLTFRYVYLAGLTEKAFPAGIGEGRLHVDQEYEQFIRDGLRLNSVAERFRDEMLLFYEAVTRADAKLCLSYPALNEKAEPLLPSPYVDELKNLFEDKALCETQMTELSAVPPAGAVVSTAERRIRAVGLAAKDDGDVSELAAVLREGNPPVVNLAHGLHVVEQRGRGFGEGFGIYEGMFAAEPALKQLMHRFDAQHLWSADQLERYGRCPHQFFLERVLNLRVPDEVGLEIDRRRRGIRLHELLVSLHTKVNRHVGREASPGEVGAAQFQTWIDELIADIAAKTDHPHAEALAEIDRRLLRRWLDGYYEQHADYDGTYNGCDAPARPRHFEVSFGLPVDAGDEASTADALELVIGEDKIRVTGRIDRIDVGRVGKQAVFSIVDYKSGGGASYTKDRVLAGEALQLTLYAVAVEQLKLAEPGAVPWHFGYWMIHDKGFKKTLSAHEVEKGIVKSTAEWAGLRREIVHRVAALVRGVRQGQFPMFNRDETCTSRCDFRTVCRVAQTRNLEKQWQLPTPARD